MTEPKRHFDLGELASAMTIYHSARRDRCVRLRELIAEHKSRFTLEQVAHLETTLAPAARVAEALMILSRRRDELPRWIVALIEDGEE